MSAGDYLGGTVFFVLILGCVGGAAALVTARRFSHLRGAPRVLGFSALATLGLVLAHLVPGALGILTRGTALGAALLVLLAGVAVSRGKPSTVVGAADPAAPPTSRWSAAIAAVAVAAAFVSAVALIAHEGDSAVSNGDALTFHLTQVARWIQTGSMWGINSFSPDWTWGTEPNTGMVVQLAFVLPWRSDPFVRLPDYVFLALTVLSVYAIARELGAPRGPACTFAAVFAATPTVMLTALDFNLPDPVMLASFGAGTLFLLRHARTGAPSELVLGAIALGLSFGTKWYALPAVAAVVVVWAGALLIARRPRPELARWGGVLCGLIALTGGFWLLRNWVALGNPMFPKRVAPLGITIFDAPFDPYEKNFGYSLAHYAGQPGVWRHWILPGFKQAFGFSALVACVGLVLSAGLALRGRWRTLEGGRVLALFLVAAAIALLYLVSPFTAAGPEGRPFLVLVSARFVLPGLLLAATLSAWAAGRLPRAGLVLEGAGALLVVHTGDRLYGGFMSHPFGVFGIKYVAYAVVVAALAAGAVALSRRARNWTAPAAAGALLLVLLVVVGYEQQKDFFPDRYRGVDATYDWLNQHAPAGQRIGLAGVSGPVADYPAPWPMHGPRLHNHVEYVGPVVKAKARPYRSRGAFVAALSRNRYDLLLVGRRVATRPVREEGWAQSAGWSRVASSGRFVLIRRPGARAGLQSPPRGSTHGGSTDG